MVDVTSVDVFDVVSLFLLVMLMYLCVGLRLTSIFCGGFVIF